jgi:hypothetical protein
MPFGDPEYGDSVAVLGLRMATSPPFCNRVDPHDSLTVWQPKLRAPSNESGKLRPLVAIITKPFTGKMSTLRTAVIRWARGCVPGAEIASLILQFVTHIECFGS